MSRRLAALTVLLCLAAPAPALDPIPDKLVVLTFDDASKSHHAVARPLLLKHKFGATFFITEGFRKNAEEAEQRLHGPNLSAWSKLLYLEVLDASFSIDGVIGAFAFTMDLRLAALAQFVFDLGPG